MIHEICIDDETEICCSIFAHAFELNIISALVACIGIRGVSLFYCRGM